LPADDASHYKSGMTVPSATILVVEDDPGIRMLVADLLRGEGFNVETAEDATEMNGVMSRLRPDLLILDVMLPGKTACRSAAGSGRRTGSRS